MSQIYITVKDLVTEHDQEKDSQCNLNQKTF